MLIHQFCNPHHIWKENSLDRLSKEDTIGTYFTIFILAIETYSTALDFLTGGLKGKNLFHCGHIKIARLFLETTFFVCFSLLTKVHTMMFFPCQ